METMKSLTQILFLLGAFSIQGMAVEVEDARDHLANTRGFIATKRANLAIQSRAEDIFGRPQNPKKAREVAATQIKKVAPKARQIPFTRILDTLPVTLMNPGSDLLILEGAGPIRAGRTIEFTFEGQPVQLRLEGVRTNGAYFRDLKSRKLHLLSNRRLPEGIKKGNQSPTDTNGIQKINPDRSAPIPIELNLAAGQPS